MAKERKVLRIGSDIEETVIEEFSWFGWEVESSQDVHEESVGVEYDVLLDPWLVSYSDDYVKLILVRDTGMKHYNEICELEEKYFIDKQISMDYDDKAVFGGGFIALIVIFYLIALVSLVASIFGTIIFGVLATLILILRLKKCKKNKELADTALEEAAYAINEAEELLNDR